MAHAIPHGPAHTAPHAPEAAPVAQTVQDERHVVKKMIDGILGKDRPDMPLIDSVTCYLVGLTPEQFVDLPADDKASWRSKAAMIAIPTLLGAYVGGSIGSGAMEVLAGGAAGGLTYRAIESSSVKALVNANNGGRSKIVKNRLLLIAFSAFIGLSTLAPKFSKNVDQNLTDNARSNPGSSLSLSERDLANNRTLLARLTADDANVSRMSFTEEEAHFKDKARAQTKEKELEARVQQEIESITKDASWLQRFVQFWKPNGGGAWKDPLDTLFKGLGIGVVDSLAFVMLLLFGNKEREKEKYDRYNKRVDKAALASDKPYDEARLNLIIDQLNRNLQHEIDTMRLNLKRAGSEGADYERVVRDSELQKLFDENIKDWVPVRQSVITTLQDLRNGIDEHDTIALEFVDGLIAHINTLEQLRQDAAVASAQKGHKIGEIADDTRVHGAEADAQVERDVATGSINIRSQAGLTKVAADLQRDGTLEEITRKSSVLAGMFSQKAEAGRLDFQSHVAQTRRTAEFNKFCQDTFVQLFADYVDSQFRLRQKQRSIFGKMWGIGRKIVWAEKTPGAVEMKARFNDILERARQAQDTGAIKTETEIRDFITAETARIEREIARHTV